jgi:hypothetical protein
MPTLNGTHAGLSSLSNIGCFAEARLSQCGVWSARSTVKGAGLGMFAGRDFETGQDLMASGDVVVPLADIRYHHLHSFDAFLLHEYTWNAAALHMDHEGFREISAFSPGFAACLNSIQDLANVIELTPEHNEGGLTLQDPGAGAFSSYHNRRTTARYSIRAGQELFANYGSNWFISRTAKLGPLPILGDYDRAEALLTRFEALLKRIPKNEVLRDFWETFVSSSPFKEKSRILFTLPMAWEQAKDAMEKVPDEIFPAGWKNSI